MRYRIEFIVAAQRALAGLPAKHQRQIIAKVESLAKEPHPPMARQLQGYSHLWRIPSGLYRIIYTVEEEALVVVVVKIGHRKEIYRRLDSL